MLFDCLKIDNWFFSFSMIVYRLFLYTFDASSCTYSACTTYYMQQRYLPGTQKFFFSLFLLRYHVLCYDVGTYTTQVSRYYYVNNINTYLPVVYHKLGISTYLCEKILNATKWSKFPVHALEIFIPKYLHFTDQFSYHNFVIFLQNLIWFRYCSIF